MDNCKQVWEGGGGSYISSQQSLVDGQGWPMFSVEVGGACFLWMYHDSRLGIYDLW